MAELPGPQAKLTRIDWIIAAALVVLVVATRIPFIPPVIADSDGAEYAFALEKFDMAHGYPHAPGYPLFILCAKPIYALTGDANISLVAVSMIFSALACSALYLWGVTMFGRTVGIVAALLLLTENSFWRFGTMWRSGPSGVLWGSVVALTAYRARIRGGRWGLISAAALGLGGGFRQQVLTFLSPMWLPVGLETDRLRCAYYRGSHWRLDRGSFVGNRRIFGLPGQQSGPVEGSYLSLLSLLCGTQRPSSCNRGAGEAIDHLVQLPVWGPLSLVGVRLAAAPAVCIRAPAAAATDLV